MAKSSDHDSGGGAATTTDVTVLGTGLMGAAVARALLRSGRSVTVWNRTASRAEPLMADGAVVAADVATAIAASPVIVSMVFTHETLCELLAPSLASGRMAGRVLFNLTTCSPGEVRDLAARAAEHGVGYVDGIILAYPEHMGDERIAVVCSGHEAAWERVADIARALGGRSHRLADDPAAASVVDIAAVGYSLTSVVAMLEALAFAQRNRVAPSALRRHLRDVVHGLRTEVDRSVDAVEAQQWATERFSLATLDMSLQLFARAVAESGQPDGTLAATAAVVRRAVDAGRGDDDAVALFPVLLGDAG